MCQTLAGAGNLKSNRFQSGSSRSNSLVISVQRDGGHGKDRDEGPRKQREEP